MRSYHSVLALSILLSAVACTEERAPTGPEATAAPELSATAAATLVFPSHQRGRGPQLWGDHNQQGVLLGQ